MSKKERKNLNPRKQKKLLKKIVNIELGMFQKIRNPTYSGLFLICAGTLMIFPTMAFLVWVIIFCIAIEFQVRVEEKFLTDTYGEQYTRYHQTTKRYIPFLY